MMKRTFDILASGCGLILCLPLFVMVAMLIKLDSVGPVIFAQRRIGKGGKAFWIYKFRTMIQFAQYSGPSITVGQDSRITRIGRFLRQWKLDELPQLWNVLTGDMSLVGPRPEISKYVQQFSQDYLSILSVRPGLTDVASIQFIDEASYLDKANNPEDVYVTEVLPEKIRLAKFYVTHQSLTFDVLVIFQTFLKLIGMRIALLDLPKSSLKNTKRQIQAVEGRMSALLRGLRRPVLVLIDLSLIIASNLLAFWVGFNGALSESQWLIFLQTLPFLLFIRGLCYFQFRINEGSWRYAGLWDLQRVAGSVVVGSSLFFAVIYSGLGIVEYPLGVLVLDGLCVIAFQLGFRLIGRMCKERMVWNQKRKVLILGGGDRVEQIIHELKGARSSQYEPVGIVEEHLSMSGQRIHGVPVLGLRKDLAAILNKTAVRELLIVLPGNDSMRLNEIISDIECLKVSVKILPEFGHCLDDRNLASSIREVAPEDLLLRKPIGTKSEAVYQMVAKKRVLVTGAGGSIGSELCRQLVALQPESVILYERHENSLYMIGKELSDHGYTSIIHTVVGDITDEGRLRETMEVYRPHIVFHAAAHKHVPMMELNPSEAIKNNCFGTRLTAEVADQVGVERFVLISTDKAVNPSSVMGATKRIAELMVQDISTKSLTRFSTVRFGNVLGSNGSVVPRFKEQIEAGGPVTITHPEIRRYFMLIPEAVHLVLHAASLEEQGATYVLDMGEQIKLIDLARNLIRLSGYVPDQDIPITFIGLRPGEKLYEELVGEHESAEPALVDKVLKLTTRPTPSELLLVRQLSKGNEVEIMKNPSMTLKRLREFMAKVQSSEIQPQPWPSFLRVSRQESLTSRFHRL